MMTLTNFFLRATCLLILCFSFALHSLEDFHSSDYIKYRVTPEQIVITDQGIFVLSDPGQLAVQVPSILSDDEGLFTLSPFQVLEVAPCNHISVCSKCRGCSTYQCWNKCKCRYSK